MHLLIPNYKILPARNFQELSEIDTLNFRCQDSLYSTLVLMLSVRSSQDTLQSSSLSSKYGPSRFKNPRWRWLWNSRLQKGNPQTSGWRHSGFAVGCTSTSEVHKSAQSHEEVKAHFLSIAWPEPPVWGKPTASLSPGVSRSWKWGIQLGWWGSELWKVNVNRPKHDLKHGFYMVEWLVLIMNPFNTLQVTLWWFLSLWGSKNCPFPLTTLEEVPSE